MTAAEHAERASALLSVPPGAGGEMAHALAVAQAHALTAIALSSMNALPAVQAAPAGMEAAPRTVWVAMREGAREPEGVYTTAKAGMAANPIPPKKRRIKPSWEQEADDEGETLPEPEWVRHPDGEWWNGLDLSLTEFEIEP